MCGIGPGAALCIVFGVPFSSTGVSHRATFDAFLALAPADDDAVADAGDSRFATFPATTSILAVTGSPSAQPGMHPQHTASNRSQFGTVPRCCILRNIFKTCTPG